MAAGSTTPHRTDVPEGYRLASTGDLKDPRVARTVAGGVALAVAALVAAALLLDLPRLTSVYLPA